jgi:hypothetical protein
MRAVGRRITLGSQEAVNPSEEKDMTKLVAYSVAAIAASMSSQGMGHTLPDNSLPPIQSGIYVCVKDADGNNVCDQKGNLFGRDKITEEGDQGVEKASGTVGRGPDVSVSASVTGHGSGAGYGPRDVGSSTITYAFEVFGPDGYVDVDYAASGAVTVSPGSTLEGAAYAALTFSGPDIEWQICSGEQGFCGVPWNGGNAFQAGGPLTVQANTVYYAVLSVQATDPGDTTAFGTVSATADNTMSVSPAYAAKYKIKFSKGVIPRK